MNCAQKDIDELQALIRKSFKDAKVFIKPNQKSGLVIIMVKIGGKEVGAPWEGSVGETLPGLMKALS